MEDLLQVGTITSTHGLKGEVKVYPATDDIKRFKKLKKVLLDTGKEYRELEVEGVKFFKQMVILKFKGIDNINEVENYRGTSLFVTREHAVKLEKNEYFISDMIGLRVVTEEGEELGILTQVLETGANDVYVVKGKEEQEILLPAILECILEVDTDNKRMKVHLMEGLLD